MRRTRQRQGRDFPPFSIHEYLNNTSKAIGAKHIAPDEITDTDAPDLDGQKKSVIADLVRFKAEAEENALPVDGCEPPELSL